jgi:hypothetical protein
VVVLIERGIGIDLRTKAFAQDQFGVRYLQAAMEFGSAGCLDTVIGPEHLRAVRHRNGFERLLAWMRRRKRTVPARVPVLRQDDVRKASGKVVDDRHDLIAIRNRKRPAGTKIILYVDDQQDVAVTNGEIDRHCPSCPLPTDASDRGAPNLSIFDRAGGQP